LTTAEAVATVIVVVNRANRGGDRLRVASLVVALLALVAAAADSAYAWSWPTTGEVLRPFVFGDDPYDGGLHRGVDVAGHEGERVFAPAGGRVAFAGTVPGSGRTVTIETADGYSVTLLHLGAVGVERGNDVAEGAAVGTVGTSGDAEWPRPYVHLGVRVTADRHGYVDPLTLLPTRTPAPAFGPPSVTGGSVRSPSPTVKPPVARRRPPPAAPEPPEVVTVGEAPSPPAPSTGAVFPSATRSTGREAGGRPVPPVSSTGLPSVTRGSPSETPAAASPPPPQPVAEPVGTATSPAVPAATPPQPVGAPVGPEPEPPALTADPTAVPVVAAWPYPELDDARFGVLSPGAEPRLARLAAPNAGARARRGWETVAVGGPTGVSRAHVPSVRSSVRHGPRRDAAGSPRPEGGERVALDPRRALRNAGAMRAQGGRAAGDRVLGAMRMAGPASVLTLALLVVLASCRRRDRAAVAAVGDGGPDDAATSARTAGERSIQAACRARPSRHRRRGGACGRAAAADPIAALLAAPRPRPAPQPAFRGRSGRSVAMSHRTRRARLAEVR
jgi:Peptidase family M23